MCKNMHSVKVPILRYGVKVTHVCSDRLLLEPMHVYVLCVINGKTVFVFILGVYTLDYVLYA